MRNTFCTLLLKNDYSPKAVSKMMGHANLIDFSRASKAVKGLFEDISDLNYLFLQLQLQYKVDLHERKSLIIFDEV